MKSDVKKFEKGSERMVYDRRTKVAKVWADDMASARLFFLKNIDGGDVGVVKSIAVTLSYAPTVTFIIRGKHLYPFVQSDMNDKSSYRRTAAFAKEASTKPSFTKMIEKQEKKVLEEWVELVIYCPSTQRFLFEIARGKCGFPMALVSKNGPEDAATTRLGDLSASVVTSRHTKKVNEVSADGVKHHFFFMVCKHEFLAPSIPGIVMKWAPHKIENKNYITGLMFEKDPTIKQIVESESKPASQKIDFTKIIDDILD